MKKCTRKCLCVECDRRATCPPAVRKDKRSRRPMSNSASPALMRRAASLLADGWYTCKELGRALYGDPGKERSSRMASMVKARRPINRMNALGLLAVRPNPDGVAEYTLLPGNEDLLL